MLFYELKLSTLNTDVSQNTKTLLFEKLNDFFLKNHLEIIQARCLYKSTNYAFTRTIYITI